MRRWWLLWILVALVARPAGASPGVLVPVDGQRLMGESAWLVVRSSEPPGVSLDGQPVVVTRSSGVVHHIRLSAIRAEGSRVSVSWEGGGTDLTVFGRALDPDSFHPGRAGLCADCHGEHEARCNLCHRWPESKHSQLHEDGCVECHPGPGRTPVDLETVCRECHDGYGGKHPRFRHAMRAANDPLRPGRPLDCASCHDPHAPGCLSCLGKADRRRWCRKCHGM